MKTVQLIKLLLLLIPALLFPLILLAVDQKGLDLTKEEQDWIDAHPTLTVGNETDWPPFDYAEDGIPKGYSIDLMRLIAEKTGLNIEFVNGYTWDQLLQKLRAGEIDVLPAIYDSTDRRAYTAFTKSYYSQPSVIVVRQDSKNISDLTELSGKRVAAAQGYAITEALERNYPYIEIVPVSNSIDGMKTVSVGSADAFVDSIGFVSYILQNNYIPNIKVITDAELKEVSNPSIHMGVAKNNTILRSILDKALASINREEENMLHDRWLTYAIMEEAKVTDKQKLELSEAQRMWLKEHPVIKIAPDIDWPPFEWVDENKEYKGIVADYMRLIEEKLGIEFYIEKEKPWPEVVEDVKQHKLDVFSCIARNPQREKYLSFTRPYLSFPMVIVTRDTSGYIDGVNSLKKMRIGVVKGYATHEFFQANHPEFDVRTSRNAVEGLQAVSKGETDAFIGNLATTTYIIHQKGLTNIKISGEMPIRYDLGVAVRKDWPQLVAMLQQALDSISEEQKNQIYNKWIGVRYEHGFDYSLFWKVSGAFLLVVGFFYFHNRKLAQEVGRRKFVEDELKNINRELVLARDNAQKANTAKSEFLSRMSHELRTPLTAIIGFAELFCRDDKLSEDHKKDASIIHNSGKHLLDIINDVLDLSKIESNKIELSMKDVSLIRLVDECLNLIIPLAQERDIRIIDRVSAKKDYVIHVDHTRAKQVLLNLLSNAVKYNYRAGEITVNRERLEDERVRISVTDSGIGLTKQQMENLFNPFDRLGAESSHIKGTGIGLMITKKLVDMMGGAIGVESKPYKGSTFWIDFNLSRADNKNESTEKALEIDDDSSSNSTKNILYIEDMEPNIRLVSHILKKHTTHNLISASSAKLGLELASTEKPDLILLDIGLPDMDGYEVLKRLMDNEQTQNIPVVALSANAMKANVQRALDEGFKAYLTKPIGVSNLLACINNIYNHKQ